MTNEAQKEWRKKWIEALRSGKYQQCKGQLSDGKGFCCLGVLCEISGQKYKAQYGNLNYFPEVRKMVGLASPHGGFEWKGFGETLTELNDISTSFSEIADIIEAEPEGLFND